MVGIRPEWSCTFLSLGLAHPCCWYLGGQGVGVASHCGTKDVPLVSSIYFYFIFLSFSSNFISTKSGKVETWGKTRGRKRKEVVFFFLHF